MNSEIEAAGRRITLIFDPHIKVSDDYFVYKNGMEIQMGDTENSSTANIFIRKDDTSPNPFYGDCWPNNSTWIDFLNTNAQNFWSNLYSSFEGGNNYLYSAWNDMNEPSVFDTATKTMDLNAIHVKDDGTFVKHLEFHNAYGALQQKASFAGMLQRDDGKQRPFVLTRSFFVGSQKYGAYWTGDNRCLYSEIKGAMNMIIQVGNAGQIFGGSDLPCFYGMPTEEMWIMFMQLGMYEPFFRAHTNELYLNREPWLQTQRVQTVLRDVMSRRYSLIHYIYTTFEFAT